VSAGPVILPGKAIGILGGGQLGRMLAQAAQTLGYRVHVYDPDVSCPAAGVCHHAVHAAYEDAAALTGFAAEVDVLTYEFENIPTEPLRALGAGGPLRPGAAVLHICQNRQREKTWLKEQGFPHVAYADALDGDVRSAVERIGLPCVVKTADFGYDGKGQMRIGTAEELDRAAAIFRGRRCVVERWVDYVCEVSVIVARTEAGAAAAYPPTENLHTRHILDVSVVPARIADSTARAAEALALAIADRLRVAGLLAVEMFVTEGGQVVVNELAPRPHNSGHWTIEGAVTSQFEQHIRAICGLPLGPVAARGPIAMCNLLGDLWGSDQAPDWLVLLGEPRAKLHLYGKAQARPGRKMGHFTVTGETAAAASAAALALKAKLAIAGK
jgi:5-(carboxyamino)imidazole ribonucleotide synthase